MAFAPQTDVKLLNLPLAPSMKHQLTFSNQTEQQNYFNNYVVYEFDDFTYQRKNSSIRVPLIYDNVTKINYIMYKNENSPVPWIYAKVIGYKYINDNVTEIAFTVDVFQTWQFNFKIKPSFVERMHLPYFDSVRYWMGYVEPENIEASDPCVLHKFTFQALAPIYILAYSRNPVEDGYVQNPPSSLPNVPIINGVPNRSILQSTWSRCSRKSCKSNARSQ